MHVDVEVQTMIIIESSIWMDYYFELPPDMILSIFNLCN